ncbi:unnamed protein product [Brassicogethes aeneus]|uniref:Fucosyltransferase n=1 Tax=Brassicogethes aeneus TaxID=1431903 RepID=A0A9P0BJA4_BRAAE|nr:unnamed protein product [Brassicogethes aeneus]
MKISVEKNESSTMSLVRMHKKAFLLGTVLFTTTILIILQNDNQEYRKTEPVGYRWKAEGYPEDKIQEWMDLRMKMKSNMSELGKILFLNKSTRNIVNRDKRYKILVWKYASTIEQRHMTRNGQRINPLDGCSVSNCDITNKDEDLKKADIVIYHLHRMKGLKDLPQSPRNPNQIWAFLTDESPYHTFLDKVKLKEFNGVFNWSMTYRMDSEIPVPYGRTILTSNPDNLEFKLDKRRDVLVAILGSNCGGKNHRWEYVRELQKHIKVDVYGKCGTFKTCPGHFRSNCKDIDRYMFYLAFENSNCDEYLTEKVWWNAFEKNSIPVVMGANIYNYKKLLPLGSYLNIDQFASPRDLAEYIKVLNKTEGYLDMYNWKKNFKVLNEHGYFNSKSYHYCRICEALNYNGREKKVYNNLDNFWSVKKNCHASWDAI